MKRKNKEEVIDLKSFSNDLLEESTVLFSNSNELLNEKMIDDKYQTLKKQAMQIDNEYGFALVYSYAFYLNGDFENAFNDISMGYKISKKNESEVEDMYKQMKLDGFHTSIENNTKLNDHLNLALALQRNVLASFKELKDLYLNNISMTAISISLRKNGSELLELADRIKAIIDANNESLTRAREYIYYHSGEKIVKLVKKIVEGTKSLNDHTQLDIHHEAYYINSDCIITLEIKEWTELYNKFKFVFKMLNGIDEKQYLDIKEALEDFEANYMIIILNEEMERLKK